MKRVHIGTGALHLDIWLFSSELCQVHCTVYISKTLNAKKR